MRSETSKSWTLAYGIDYFPNVLLSIRDALALEVPDELDVPPKMEGFIPDLSSLVTTDSRSVAGLQWLDWWRSTVNAYVRLSSMVRVDEEPTRHRAEVLHDHIDPPGFESLSGMSNLHSGVVRVFGECSHRVITMQRDMACSQEQDMFDWELGKSAAEEVAARYHTEVGRLRATVSVLLVKGVWFYKADRGFAQCSLAASQDQTMSRDIVIRAFESSLGM